MVGAVPADEALLDNGLISMQRLRRTIKHAATCEWRPRSDRRHNDDTATTRRRHDACTKYILLFILYCEASRGAAARSVTVKP